MFQFAIREVKGHISTAVFNPFSPLPTAGTDFAQTGSLVKDRHLLQRQMSSTGKRNHYYCNTNQDTLGTEDSVLISEVS